ncbi:MAG: M23 family metallopeptidase [Gammaproteobacteria bacterium]
MAWALAVFAVILIALTAAGVDLPGWQVMLLYGAVYAGVAMVLARRSARSGDVPDYSHLPTSGPVGRGGQALLAFTFTTSGLLSVINPLLLWQQLRQLAGQLSIAHRVGDDPPAADSYENAVRYRLPFDGEWFVYNGGVTQATSHSWGLLTQRYAYDFVIVDQRYARHHGRGTRCEDYFCYGRPILAAADGEVVAMRDRVRDSWFLGYGIIDFLTTDFRGNFVIIRHAPSEYGFYAHLVPGSLAVSVGDRVSAGQPVGRCGHSGFSSEPHLHFHLQDRPDFYTAMGLPVRFEAVEETERQIDSGAWLTAGSKVRHADQ